MSERDVQVTRWSRVRKIQRTRLGGIDRIFLDRVDDDAPIERFAHIYASSLATNLVDMPTLETCEAYRTEEWSKVGIIDLDTGDLANG